MTYIIVNIANSRSSFKRKLKKEGEPWKQQSQ